MTDAIRTRGMIDAAGTLWLDEDFSWADVPLDASGNNAIPIEIHIVFGSGDFDTAIASLFKTRPRD